MQSVSKISNLCDHNPPTSQTDGQTDRRTDGRTDTMQSQYRAMHIVHRAVKNPNGGCLSSGCGHSRYALLLAGKGHPDVRLPRHSGTLVYNKLVMAAASVRRECDFAQLRSRSWTLQANKVGGMGHRHPSVLMMMMMTMMMPFDRYSCRNLENDVGLPESFSIPTVCFITATSLHDAL